MGEQKCVSVPYLQFFVEIRRHLSSQTSLCQIRDFCKYLEAANSYKSNRRGITARIAARGRIIAARTGVCPDCSRDR